MTTFERFARAAALALLLSRAAAGADKLQVVTTLADLRDIAEQVGGERVEAISLAAGGQDPHFVDPKPSYMVKLRGADLFILNGLELEIGWVPPLLDGARNPRVQKGGEGYLDASAGVPLLEVPSSAVTRAEGDIHPFGNPHYLLDPLNGKIAAGTIALRLAALDPERKADYEARRKAFARQIDERMFGLDLVDAVGGQKLDRLARDGGLDEFLKKEGLEARLGGWLGAMRPHRGAKVVTYHRNLSYLANRFGLDVIEYIEPKPGIPPSAHHMVEVVAAMKRAGARVVLTQPYYGRTAADLVAEKVAGQVVVVSTSVGGVEAATSYLALFDDAIARLAQALAAGK